MYFYYFVLLWCGLGLLGALVGVLKNHAIPFRALVAGMFSIPVALAFGPVFLILALATPGEAECPHCRSLIHAAAAVCPKCTRTIASEA